MPQLSPMLGLLVMLIVLISLLGVMISLHSSVLRLPAAPSPPARSSASLILV